MTDPVEDPGDLPSTIEPQLLGVGELFARVRDALVIGEAGSGRIVVWNAAAAELFGYDDGDGPGLHLDDLVPESLRGRHREGLRRYAETGRGALVDSGRVLELPALRRDCSTVWVELTLTPLDGARLGGHYLLAIVRDVTERRTLEEAHRDRLATEAETIRQLRELHELKDGFLTVAAHDLRTPLTALRGFAELLATRGREMDDRRREEILGIMVETTERLDRLVKDYLHAAEREADAIPISTSAVDLGSLLRDLSGQIEARHTGHPLDLELPRDLPRARGDRERIAQVLRNLLSNAVRYSPPDAPIRVRCRASEVAVEVSIEDDGRGIAPGDLPRIFDKFARGDGEQRDTGTGLGLYIARSLVEAMDGTIWAESPAEGGARFVFRLPLATHGEPID